MISKILKLKHFKRIIILIFILGVSGLISIFAINFYVKSSTDQNIISQKEASDLEDIDCILVLGAMVWDNERPSYMLEDRLIQGIDLYDVGASDRIIMSGDHGQADYDEVNIMKQYAVDLGVPSEKIFMDHAGFSTYESIYRARDIFQVDKIVIVTQEYHLYRALYIAEELGLEAYGVPSNPREYAGQSGRDLREVLARLKDFFNVIFEPEPTYLGDTIPVSGNGDKTNDN